MSAIETGNWCAAQHAYQTSRRPSTARKAGTGGLSEPPGRSSQSPFVPALDRSGVRAANTQSPRTSKRYQTRRQICGCFAGLAAPHLKQAILASAQPRLKPRSPMARRMQAQRLLDSRRAAEELATGSVRERETNEEIRDLQTQNSFRKTSGSDARNLRYPGVEKQCLTKVAPSLRMPSVGYNNACSGQTQRTNDMRFEPGTMTQTW
jgi:hypothetical protein